MKRLLATLIMFLTTASLAQLKTAHESSPCATEAKSCDAMSIVSHVGQWSEWYPVWICNPAKSVKTVTLQSLETPYGSRDSVSYQAISDCQLPWTMNSNYYCLTYVRVWQSVAGPKLALETFKASYDDGASADYRLWLILNSD